jgi:hypothetical protein
MSNRDIMFAAWLLLGGYIITNLCNGAYFGSSDANVMNSLMIMKTYNLFGLIPIPLLNVNFFTTGLVAMTTWNFSFFEGAGYDMFKYLLYIITIGLVWGIAVAFSGFAFWRNAV